MSSIQNVITTTFRARGNQAIATMGGVAQGFGTIMGRIGDTSRMSERLNNQWRAIGTTFRYAIAGTALYGLAGLVNQLKEVQQQLGLISAIGETSTGAPILGNALDKLLSQSRQGAVDSLTPLQDYNNAVINLLSTIQGIPQDQITPIVTQISQAAKLAQVNAEDATKAFTTMNVAFGKPTNLKNITQMAQEFFILTREAPGGVAAGQQVITQLGQLAQVTRAAHGTPEDMFSLLLSTLRSGIPPAQAGRGLQFLIQTVALPGSQTKPAQQALASVGITPASEMPLQQRLARIFAKARSLGIQGNIGKIKNLDEETLADLEAQGTTGAFKDLGITGRGAEFLGQIFRRIHALRTALALEGQINVGQAQKDLKEMNGVVQGHVSDINNLDKAWKRFADQAKLQQASIALQTMGLQVAQVFEPVLNLAAKGIVNVSQAAQHHQTATKIATYGAAGFLAAMGVGRFFGVNLFRGIAGRGFLASKAIEDATTHGGMGLGASPQNPLYVIVVGEIFGRPVTGGGSPLPGGGRGIDPTDPVNDYFAYKGIRKIGGLVRRGGRRILGRAGTVEAGAADALEVATKSGLATRIGLKGIPIAGSVAAFLMDAQNAGSSENDWIGRLDKARKLFGNQYGNIVSTSKPELGKFHGKAEVFMTLTINQPNGKEVKKKVHIPVNMYEGGRYPTQSGKAGSKRAGG